MNENISKKSLIKWRRPLMGGAVSIVAAVAGILYITGGRYVETDNAYIKSPKILVTSEVTGAIEKTDVTDFQAVKAGDTLAVIDSRQYRIALQKAEADLAATARRIGELKAAYRQKTETIAREKLEAAYTAKEYERRAGLKTSVSESEKDDFKRRRDEALKDIDISTAELDQIMAQLGGDDTVKTEDQPDYKAAQAAFDQAKLNLERTEIKAPVSGYINAAPRLGDYARTSAPLLTMIDTGKVWIEANFKETQLTSVRVGQPVSIHVDTYPGIEFRGTVESISPGSGSEFSILPAQNATGNWVKIVQRVAVRISIDNPPENALLRAGMSGNVTIDTGSYPHLSWGEKTAG